MADLLGLIPFVFIVISAFLALYLSKKRVNKKVLFLSQIISTFLVSAGIFAYKASNLVMAAESSGVSNAVSGDKSIGFSIGLIAAALALGLAAVAAGVALASAIPAAIAAMSENEKTFGKSMVFAIFGEAIVLYGFLIAIFILNKLDMFVGVN
jgi:V/A-type H+-transporting ATPase subunit K